jgi:hypothetical protein
MLRVFKAQFICDLTNCLGSIKLSLPLKILMPKIGFNGGPLTEGKDENNREPI